MEVVGTLRLGDRERRLLREQDADLGLLGLGAHVHEVHGEVTSHVVDRRVDPDLHALGRGAAEGREDLGGVGDRLALALEVEREDAAGLAVDLDITERDVDESAGERDARDEDAGGDRVLVDRETPGVIAPTIEGVLHPRGLGGVEAGDLGREVAARPVLDREPLDERVDEGVARAEQYPDAAGAADHHGGGAGRGVEGGGRGGDGTGGGVDGVQGTLLVFRGFSGHLGVDCARSLLDLVPASNIVVCHIFGLLSTQA